MRGVLLFLCLLFIVGFVAVEAKYTKCKYTCGCSLTRKTPVCGASGRTHQNHCLAHCYNDKIVKEGRCQPKTPIKRSIKRTCSKRRHGAGFGTYCCAYTQVGNKTTRKCSWVGCVTLGRKTNCYWKKRPSNTRSIRRYCCPYTVQKCGSSIRRVREGRCSWIGKALTSTQHNNCSWKKFGALGRRRYCCSKKVTCSGKKKCVTHAKKCRFVGSIITSKRREVCSFQTRGKHCRQMRCTAYVQRCVSKPGSKRCNVKTKKCRTIRKRKTVCRKRFVSRARWVGKKLCKRNRKRFCSYRKYGKVARRKRCCTFYVRHGKRYGLRCKWVGCARRQTIKVKCSIKKNGKTYQRQCCTWRRICKCSTCARARRSCRWVGRKVKIHHKRKCYRVAISNNAYQTRCCVYKKKYNRHTKSFKLVKRCYYKNDSRARKRFIKCHWKKISRHRRRRLCIIYERICKRHRCSKARAVSKRYVGYTLYIIKSKNCIMKRTSKNTKRKQCCHNVKVCRGKGNCRQKRKCKFLGTSIRRIQRHKCHWRFYKKTASKKKYCCRWTDFCRGRKCQPQGKSCKWQGATLRYKSKQVCQKLKVHGGYRRRCRTISYRCINKACRIVKRSKWQWAGNKVSTKYIRNCVFKNYGRFRKRKFCKRFHKKCNGANCKLRFREQGWVGPVFTKKPKSKCYWKRVKGGYLPYCCNWFIRCIGKCPKGGKPPRSKQCKPMSKKVVKLGKKNQCKWRQYRKKYRRQYCCSTIRRNVHHSKPLHACSWKGKAYKLKRVFYKKRKICTKHQCCQQLSKCSRHGGCHVLRNQRCRPYTRKHSNYCYSYGNSWVRPFHQKSYRHALAGDFNLIESKRLTCHQRSVQWKNGLVTLYAFACKVNGDIVESVTKNPREYLINKTFKLKLSKNQVYKLPKGGYIKLYSNDKVIIDSGAGYLSAIYTKWDEKSDQDRWVSLAVKVPSTKTFRGMCSSKVSSKSAKGLFLKEFHTKTVRIPTRSCSRRQRKQYIRDCKRIGVKYRNLLHRCVFDLTRGMPLDSTRYLLKLQRFVHGHKLRLRQITLKRAHKRIVAIKAKKFIGRNLRKGLRKGTNAVRRSHNGVFRRFLRKFARKGRK
eukprot:gene9848-2171_t